MTSSGLWTPNRDSDPTLERGPIWYLLDPISRGTGGVIPSQDGLIPWIWWYAWDKHPTVIHVCMVWYTTYTIPLEMSTNRVSEPSQVGVSYGSDVRFEVFPRWWLRGEVLIHPLERWYTWEVLYLSKGHYLGIGYGIYTTNTCIVRLIHGISIPSLYSCPFVLRCSG